MATVYAALIAKGIKTFNHVPTIIQPEVKAVLEALNLGKLAR